MQPAVQQYNSFYHNSAHARAGCKFRWMRMKSCFDLCSWPRHYCYISTRDLFRYFWEACNIIHKMFVKHARAVLFTLYCSTNPSSLFSVHSINPRAEIAQSVQRIGYGLDSRRTCVWFPAGVRDFSLFHIVHTGSESHPLFYTMVTESSSPRVKLNISLNLVPRWRIRGATLHSPIHFLEVMLN
jgi:hypothetical protein